MATHPRKMVTSAAARGTAFIRILKLRALGVIACTIVVAIAIFTSTTLPFLATLGVAVAAVAVVSGAVHGITHRLHESPTCLACGENLAAEPQGVHGIICPKCGSIHSGSVRRLAQLEEGGEPDRA